MKCSLCEREVEEDALGKMKGTYVVKGKKRMAICSECQQGIDLKELKERL